MECQIVFQCDCNQKTYPSKQALTQHQKTKNHVAWRERNELKQLKIELTDKTNTIVALTNQNGLLKELNQILVQQIGYLKTHSCVS
jgi:hypothetical protein